MKTVDLKFGRLALRLALMVGVVATLSGCAGRYPGIVSASNAPVQVRSSALLFDSASVRRSLVDQSAGADALRWEYARNNSAVGARTHAESHQERLFRGSEWYGSPERAPRIVVPYGVGFGYGFRPTAPLLSPARERWWGPPY